MISSINPLVFENGRSKINEIRNPIRYRVPNFRKAVGKYQLGFTNNVNLVDLVKSSSSLVFENRRSKINEFRNPIRYRELNFRKSEGKYQLVFTI